MIIIIVMVIMIMINIIIIDIVMMIGLQATLRGQSQVCRSALYTRPPVQDSSRGPPNTHTCDWSVVRMEDSDWSIGQNGGL